MLIGCSSRARGTVFWTGALLLAFLASSEAVVQSLSSPLDADRIPVLLVPGWGDEAVYVLPLRD